MSSETLFNYCLSLLILGATYILGTTSIQVTITPQVLHRNSSTAVITCNADVPLSGCQIMWIDDERQSGPTLDLSRGNRTLENPYAIRQYYLKRYTYHGRGLQSGDCGVVMTFDVLSNWFMGCRVRVGEGAWSYAWIDPVVGSYDVPGSVTVTPREVVALPGNDAVLSCSASRPLGACQFWPPGVPDFLMIDHGPRSPDFSGRHFYHGTGLERGDCGLRIVNVTESDNGFSRCYTIFKEGEDETRYIPIIVARAPRGPMSLEVTKQGSDLQATCSVGSSRPPANITWLLGNTVLRQDNMDDSLSEPTEAWRWPWVGGPISQTITYHLDQEDRGKMLRCRVTHAALAKPLETARSTSGDDADSLNPEGGGSPGEMDDSGDGCPPLTSSTLSIRCYLHGELRDCARRQQVTTVAQLNCKPGHVPATNVVFKSVTCREGGTWSRRSLYGCIPDCGRRNPLGSTTLVSNGTNAIVGEFPWHVAVYYQESRNNTPEHVCGATLITPSIVISAAHCFFNDARGKLNETSAYRVSAGQLLRHWDDPDTSVQKRQLSYIRIPGTYHGSQTNFGSDIAVLGVTRPFHVTTRVNLACVDWENTFDRQQLRTGNTGIVAGWGLTEDSDVLSEHLKHIELPFVLHEKCYDSLTEELQNFLTNDKFCAGFINQSKSVCGGDSGGGLLFPQSGTGKYYLRGLVSLAFRPSDYNGPPCYNQHYGGFTQLSSHLQWINDNL